MIAIAKSGEYVAEAMAFNKKIISWNNYLMPVRVALFSDIVYV